MADRAPIVSSFAVMFKQAVKLTEDVKEAKKEHRQSLKTLIDKYMDDVQTGEAQGIRHARDLVEIMKMDLLLMGEATERTDDIGVNEARVTKITQMLDPESPEVQTLMDKLMKGLNEANDDEDIDVARMNKEQSEEAVEAQVEEDKDNE